MTSTLPDKSISLLTALTKMETTWMMVVTTAWSPLTMRAMCMMIVVIASAGTIRTKRIIVTIKILKMFIHILLECTLTVRPVNNIIPTPAFILNFKGYAVLVFIKMKHIYHSYLYFGHTR
jgi:hypothetical protein